jgi:hypothetical protein
MEFFAFASFAILLVGWLIAPSRAPVAAAEAEERKAA